MIRVAGKLLKNASIILISNVAIRLGLANHEVVVAGKVGIGVIVRSTSGFVDNLLSKNIVKNPSRLDCRKNYMLLEILE